MMVCCSKSARVCVYMLAMTLLASLAARAQSRNPASAYIPFSEARAVLGSTAGVATQIRTEAAWDRSVRRHDREIRDRLARGEEDSLGNLLIYGTSFTHQPRLTPELMHEFEVQAQSTGSDMSAVIQRMTAILDGRIADLIAALTNPGGNERLRAMRRLVLREGFSTATSAGRLALGNYLRSNLARVRQEYVQYRQELRAMAQSADSAQAMAERSQMFEARGISLDTSLLPNFALDQAVTELRARGLLAPHSVRRVAIIGPGLDFADKGEGYDFYPQQTIQPFAIMDTLMRLELANPRLRITTLDISTRVNQHIARAVWLAREGKGYVVQLPRDPAHGWNAAAKTYWEQFGSKIGSTVAPVQPPSELGRIQLRAVRIRPEAVRRLDPVDLDVIYQRLELPPSERFDMVIATNMFVYYGGFEQALALINVGHMLRPGGFLLSNDALPEAPTSGLHEAGRTAVTYSDQNALDGDRITWYQRQR